jgi:H+-translocating NAD(P) transhydrogenase subunit alpha
MSPAYIAAEMALFAAQAKEVDIIITTALIPNRPAPVLITEDMVLSMKKGSVIVDLAAENGGNCALTEPGSVVQRHGVHIIGYIDLPSRLAPTASVLYGNNLAYLLDDLGGAANFHIDLNDEVVRNALIVHDGTIVWPPPRREPPATPPKMPAAPTEPSAIKKPARSGSQSVFAVALALGVLGLIGLGFIAPPVFLSHLTVFALACVVGWQVVWNVTPALHTPLMSVTNAISGIIVVGGMLSVSGNPTSAPVILGAAAILLAAINIAGGFLVTQRMLRMFRR